MENLLITYGTRPFAQRVGRLLSARYNIIYGSSEPFPDIMLKQGYHRLPTGANPTFAHEILKLCLDTECQKVLPLGKMELQPLHEARVLLAEYGIEVLAPVELEDCLILENPPGDVRVLHEGKDLLTGEKLTDVGFSGAAMLSDSGEEALLCLV